MSKQTVTICDFCHKAIPAGRDYVVIPIGSDDPYRATPVKGVAGEFCNTSCASQHLARFIYNVDTGETELFRYNLSPINWNKDR